MRITHQDKRFTKDEVKTLLFNLPWQCTMYLVDDQDLVARMNGCLVRRSIYNLTDYQCEVIRKVLDKVNEREDAKESAK